jgi:MerR family transcriptional regulator/heat shock protein HspR
VLNEVVRLSGLGLGLEGVRQVLELEHHMAALQARVRELEVELDSIRERDRRTALVVWRPGHPRPRR